MLKFKHFNSFDKPKGSTSALLQLFEMKENLDSEIEDFGLDSSKVSSDTKKYCQT